MNSLVLLDWHDLKSTNFISLTNEFLDCDCPVKLVLMIQLKTVHGDITLPLLTVLYRILLQVFCVGGLLCFTSTYLFMELFLCIYIF